MSCRQDMHDQPKYEPLERSAFFGDERSARPLVEGTVARGHLQDNPEYFTGKTGEAFITTFPLEVTEELVQRGQERYNIFCTPCHGVVGDGLGMIVRRGFKKPPSFHIDRLRQSPPGYFYDVMTNGFGVMSSYAEQVPVKDRWAITAYVRALQLSQHATLDDVPPEKRKELEAEKAQ
jgi:mono/diheme cytochrome c family protein